MTEANTPLTVGDVIDDENIETVTLSVAQLRAITEWTPSYAFGEVEITAYTMGEIS